MFEGSYITVDLKRIADNYKIIKDRIGKKIIAVVKADAYGHGAVNVARTLFEAGCRDFAVASVKEGAELRKKGIGGEILVLGYTPAKEKNALKKYDLTQSLFSLDHAKNFAGSGVKVQLAIDTGMKRAGIDINDENALEAAAAVAEKCRLTGLYTHLCAADDEKCDEQTLSAIKSFTAFSERFSEKNVDIHIYNSAGVLRFPVETNAVRVGIALYGIKPSDAVALFDGIKPALVWESVISSVRKVEKGESVGYGRSFFAKDDMIVATVCTGYADGYPRALSNLGEVVIKGSRARIVGRICMDCFTVDVTDISGVSEGDTATLVGNGITVSDVAKSLSTIDYEVLSRIGKRVKRRYIG